MEQTGTTRVPAGVADEPRPAQDSGSAPHDTSSPDGAAVPDLTAQDVFELRAFFELLDRWDREQSIPGERKS